MKPEMHGATEVAEDALEQGDMRCARRVHDQAELLDCIGDVRAGQREVLECPSETAKERRIRGESAIGGGEFGFGVDGGGYGFAIEHGGAVENFESVLLLREKKPARATLHVDAKKMVESAEVGHGKLGGERGGEGG